MAPALEIHGAPRSAHRQLPPAETDAKRFENLLPAIKTVGQGKGYSPSSEQQETRSRFAEIRLPDRDLRTGKVAKKRRNM
jgi:hypothetical protein